MIGSVNSLHLKPDYVLIDGNRLPSKSVIDIPLECIVKGDQRSVSIAAASVVAKVTRDRLMDEFHSLWPQYGFNKNRGYPTSSHITALKQHGLCPIHRLTFSPVRQMHQSTTSESNSKNHSITKNDDIEHSQNEQVAQGNPDDSQDVNESALFNSLCDMKSAQNCSNDHFEDDSNDDASEAVSDISEQENQELFDFHQCIDNDIEGNRIDVNENEESNASLIQNSSCSYSTEAAAMIARLVSQPEALYCTCSCGCHSIADFRSEICTSSSLEFAPFLCFSCRDNCNDNENKSGIVHVHRDRKGLLARGQVVVDDNSLLVLSVSSGKWARECVVGKPDSGSEVSDIENDVENFQDFNVSREHETFFIQEPNQSPQTNLSSFTRILEQIDDTDCIQSSVQQFH